MASFKTYWKAEVHNAEGKRISAKERACHSFTLQFLSLLEAFMRGQAGTVTAKDTLNSDESIPESPADLGGTIMLYAVDDDDVYGTIVGTGSTAPTTTDYVMETPIAHGVGAGELDYNVQSFVAAAEVGANSDLQLVRTFTNSSGNSITVEEVGLYARSENDAGVTKYFLILRDVTGGVVVANGETLTVTFTLRTTV